MLGMKPVGNYAYAIEFSDGHDTGIYTCEFLRELGQEMPA
ncbi:MAG TPA: gamma-butyrobetaine hydroxylase-like domain-containing protein [Pirellulales bacterium]|nr:gamma-butyrobetaine hydroxylase-like domain-containing protein [Pirellulales bacterium]